MPADRLINVNLSATGARDDHGEYIPGDVTTIRTWASKRDRSQEDINAEGGERMETRRDWRIRWDSRIAVHSVALMEVVDDKGWHWNMLNMVEVTRQRGAQDLRRRYLDIQAVFST